MMPNAVMILNVNQLPLWLSNNMRVVKRVVKNLINDHILISVFNPKWLDVE